MRIFLALFFAAVTSAVAQTPEVPHKMQVAGITLSIRDDARKEIQKDVDALTASPKFFQVKVERAKTYFPIIEKIFAEENVPDDFKYLVLQESALIADAVSTSNAVGFWQFKDFTAIEMGMRVDKEIDERMNIVSSSRAAARYLKKNNHYFNNWLFALQAYQMGAGGVLRSVSEKDRQSGARHMEITSQTYWYVKKFLAHKVAFEHAIKGEGEVNVITYENRTKKTLGDLAKEVVVDEQELRNYNKWTKSGAIPDDRVYAVMIPVMGNKPIRVPETGISSTVASTAAIQPKASQKDQTKINSVPAVRALAGETASAFASRTGITVAEFLRYNDLGENDALRAGDFYFIKKKRTKAKEAYHQVVANESLWQISQRYGVQLARLKKFNRFSDNQKPETGSTLWLSSRKPKDAREISATPAVLVDHEETFMWDVQSSSDNTSASATPVVEPAPQKQDEPSIEQKQPVEPVVIVVPENSIGDKPDNEIQKTEPYVEPAAKEVVVVDLPETPAPSADTHVVKAGETLSSISRLYKVSVMDIVRWNSLDLQNSIHPGQVLKLVDSEPKSAPELPAGVRTTIIHEVKASDTLYSVARQYGVTIKDLMDWNQKKELTVKAGEKLTVYQK